MPEMTSEGFEGGRSTDDRMNMHQLRDSLRLYKGPIDGTNTEAWKWIDILLERSEEIEKELEQLKKERDSAQEELKTISPPENVNRAIASLALAIVNERVVLKAKELGLDQATIDSTKAVINMAKCHLGLVTTKEEEP